VATEAGIKMTNLVLTFTTTHPAVTSTPLGTRTKQQLEQLPTGVDVTLPGDVLDRIDEIAPPGTDVTPLCQAYQPPPCSARHHPPPSPPTAPRGKRSTYADVISARNGACLYAARAQRLVRHLARLPARNAAFPRRDRH
jgi:hypothetical protein